MPAKTKEVSFVYFLKNQHKIGSGHKFVMDIDWKDSCGSNLAKKLLLES